MFCEMENWDRKWEKSCTNGWELYIYLKKRKIIKKIKQSMPSSNLCLNTNKKNKTEKLKT